MDAHKFDLIARPVWSRLRRLGWYRKHTRPTLMVGMVSMVAVGGLVGCARETALEALPPAPAAGVAPQDGPAPTTMPRTTTTTSPLRTTTWTVPPPRHSTEPRTHTPVTTLPRDGDLTNDTLVAPGDMTFDAIRAVLDSHNESEDMVVLAWGDVDGDGDIDAIVLTTWCGASCGKQLDLVINNNGTPTPYSSGSDNAFEPWFIPSSAAQSYGLSVSIEPASGFQGSLIKLSGYSLCGENPMTPNPDGPCDPDLLRTATYVYHDATLNPSFIDPEIDLDHYIVEGMIDPWGEASSVEVMAWGDINGDGRTDAVARSTWCATSCETRLDLVFASDLGPTVYGDGSEPFWPFYNGSGPDQSSLTAVTIDDAPETFAAYDGSVIRLTGEGLCDHEGQSEWTDCGPTERDFVYDGSLSPLDS